MDTPPRMVGGTARIRRLSRNPATPQPKRGSRTGAVGDVVAVAIAPVASAATLAMAAPPRRQAHNETDLSSVASAHRNFLGKILPHHGDRLRQRRSAPRPRPGEDRR